MEIRNRVRELRFVKASELVPDPRNPRTHPDHQRAALTTLLEKIGYAGAVLAREDGGELVLVDGHLRADISPDAELPVLILDVNEDEAAVLLASMDPIGAMAVADAELMAQLVQEIDVPDEELAALLAEMTDLPQPVDDPVENPVEPEPQAPSEPSTDDSVYVTFRLTQAQYADKESILAECVSLLGITPLVRGLD